MIQLCDSVKMKEKSSLCFPTNKKMDMLAWKFDVVEKSYFQFWLKDNIPESSISERSVLNIEMLSSIRDSWESVVSAVRRGAESTWATLHTDPLRRAIGIKYKEEDTEPVKSGSEIAKILRVKKWDLKSISIIETKPEDYLWIVPDHIISSAESHKDMFDEIVVLEPKEEDIHTIWSSVMGLIEKVKEREEEIRVFIDDPILCWKIKWHENFYFIIDYWYNDTPIYSFAKNFKSQMVWSENTQWVLI